MPACFQEYAAHVKPALDAAVSSQLQQLLGPVVFGHPHDLPGLTGGKRIRGALLCLVTASLGGSLEAAMPRAVAVELIQTATLVHDDFVDQHRFRRNQPALWTLAGARRAVLLGDVVFSSAIHRMSELGREDCGIVAKAIADLSRGAYQEPLDAVAMLEAVGRDDACSVDYESIIALKTGILFAAACELGAVAGGVDGPQQLLWRRYGQKIGEAYQIADDLQEVAQALGRATLSPGELAELAPALRFFLPQSLAAVCGAIRSGAVVPMSALLPYLQELGDAMQTALEQRLHAATDALRGAAPEGPLGHLVRRAPWDLIGMFNAGELRVVGGVS